VTLQWEDSWYAFVANVVTQGEILAGNELSTGEWFQIPLAQCTVSFDPTQARAH
jgi:hypothetical protein